jgi:endogenous inhibitor of DNA gyrase (YacG/DUF329 family)
MKGPREDWPLYPFCCAKCRTIDLGRWLSDDYAVPAVEANEDRDVDPEADS